MRTKMAGAIGVFALGLLAVGHAAALRAPPGSGLGGVVRAAGAELGEAVRIGALPFQREIALVGEALAPTTDGG